MEMKDWYWWCGGECELNSYCTRIGRRAEVGRWSRPYVMIKPLVGEAKVLYVWGGSERNACVGARCPPFGSGPIPPLTLT